MEADKPFTEEQREVAKKIAKLLQLGHRNPSQLEAAAALKRAADLALAYNLDIAAIKGDSDGGARKQEKVRGGFYDHQQWIWQEVAELNFCLYFVDGAMVKENRVTTYSDGTKHRWTQNIWRRFHGLVGRKHNVEATKAMATYLEQAVERLVMERLGNQNNLRWSNFAVSFRKGAVLEICDKLRERRKQVEREETDRLAEAEARAKAAGASTSTAITIASLKQTERDGNLDEMNGWAPGTAAKHRMEAEAERAAQAQAKRLADQEYTRWAATHPEEAQKREAERKKEEEKLSKRRTKRETYWDNVDWGAFRGGQAAGQKIGIDTQQDTGVGRGRGLGHG